MTNSAHVDLYNLETAQRGWSWQDVVNGITFGLANKIGLTDTVGLDKAFTLDKIAKVEGIRDFYSQKVEHLNTEAGKVGYLNHYKFDKLIPGSDPSNLKSSDFVVFDMKSMPGPYIGDLNFAKTNLGSANELVTKLKGMLSQ